MTSYLPILSARRCESMFGKARTSRMRPSAASGIRFERRLHKDLATLCEVNSQKLEYQPWFEYETPEGANFCSPDFLILSPSEALVVEAKQTFYPGALEKLQDLYLPTAAKALGTPVRGVLVCKYLTPDSPRPAPSFREGFKSPTSVYHWPELGPLIW